MTDLTRCYRHKAWIAACPRCTAWHLAMALSRRDDSRHQEATEGAVPNAAARATGLRLAA